MKAIWLRVVFYAVLLAGALALAAPYIPAAFLRSRVESALSNSLNRPVQIGDVRFTFFPSGPVPGPGFALENVTIHEDTRAGIEPFAYMQELGASVRVLSLLTGRLELSGINLEDASINLVKTNEGRWNVQYLLDRLQSGDAAMPAFRMRGGRVNFKFGDTKSVFYFNAADIDVMPTLGGAIDLRFSGEPSRSDHIKQDFGRFYIRGTSAANGQLNLKMELQRSSLEETLRLMDPQGFGLHGVLAFNGQVQGDPANLQLTGNVKIGDVHRSDLLPQEGQTWDVPVAGTLNLPGEVADLMTWEKEPVVGMQFHAQNYLTHPQWNAQADFRSMPLATLFALARHMGATLPENLTVAGSVSGTARYAESSGLVGALTIRDASMQLPENEPLKAALAELEIHESKLELLPTKVEVSNTQSAQMEGSVGLASPHALALRIATRGLAVAAMKSFGLPPMPILGESAKGTWSGTARYQDRAWSGEADLRGVQVAVDGIAAPLDLAMARMSLTPSRLALSRVQGKVGMIGFAGSYETRGTQPARFVLALPDVNASELEALLAPTLAREGPGLIDRIRLRNAPGPTWLRGRRTEGTITVDSAKAGEWHARGLRGQVDWTGTALRLKDLTAQIEGATFAGTLDLDLATPATKYRLNGSLNGIPYRSGVLDVTGTAEAEGPQWLATARAEGTAEGRNIAFAPDAEFRTLSTTFQMQPIGTAPRWKLTNLEVPQGQGAGNSQDDGQLVLTVGPLRAVGPLFSVRK
jgi:hypothetical protein